MAEEQGPAPGQRPRRSQGGGGSRARRRGADRRQPVAPVESSPGRPRRSDLRRAARAAPRTGSRRRRGQARRRWVFGPLVLVLLGAASAWVATGGLDQLRDRLRDEQAAPAPPDEDVEVVGARDVQILNGNGVPRIGLEVTDRLSDGGYRVVLTGNADRFTYDTTRIVLHDDAPEQVEVGRDLQRRLGVGELEVAATPDPVVDVTIVVGADFPPP